MIIFDLDGTLADCEHRRHFVDRSAYIRKPGTEDTIFKPNWPAFYEACGQDKPIAVVIKQYHALGSTYGKESKLHIWSGRCESVREKTLKWIYKNVDIGFIESRLRMRPIGDTTPDDILKERWLDQSIAEGKTVDFVFDDRLKVIRMWRRRGIFVFNCCQHEGEF